MLFSLVSDTHYICIFILCFYCIQTWTACRKKNSHDTNKCITLVSAEQQNWSKTNILASFALISAMIFRNWSRVSSSDEWTALCKVNSCIHIFNQTGLLAKRPPQKSHTGMNSEITPGFMLETFFPRDKWAIIVGLSDFWISIHLQHTCLSCTVTYCIPPVCNLQIKIWLTLGITVIIVLV